MGECLHGTGCVSLRLCICVIIVSLNHLMGSNHIQVLVYKMVYVPMWVGSCEPGYPVSMNWGVCACLCVCLPVFFFFYKHRLSGVYHYIFELITGGWTV